MTTYPDLDPLPYFGAECADSLRAIGWLGSGHRFTKGPISADTYDRLKQLLVNPFQPLVAFGFHTCDLCQFEGESGSANLFVPADGFLFVCPELILHYINAHHYQPPQAFCDAVMICPDTRSVEYKRSFLVNGGRKLMRHAG